MTQNGNSGRLAGKSSAQVLIDKSTWWLHFLVVAGVSTAGLVALGVWTYAGAPPLADFVSPSGQTVLARVEIERGKELFHLRGLMAWGSFWGDGAERGPDFTADALHRTVLSMRGFYESELSKQRPVTQADRDAITVRVKREVHSNGWDATAGVIRLNDAQTQAIDELTEHYRRMFTDATYAEAFPKTDLISDAKDIRALSAFAFWGGWVAAADRPGESYSYTQNWPYDPDAGNGPTLPTIFWSLLSILALFLGTCLVLYIYGQMKTLPGDPFQQGARPTLTTPELESGVEHVRPTQRATYKFFAFAVVLFLCQVLAGILSAESFTGGGPGSDMLRAFGLQVPFTVARSWHLTLQIYWFFLAWIGYTLFFLPRLSAVPVRQGLLIELLFGVCVAVGVGAVLGIYLGLSGRMSDSLSYWFGSQGWEFMELGRFWQVLMLGAFVLWIAIIFRAVRPWIRKQNLWSVPAWLFYGSGIMVLFLFFGLMVTPTQNFAISDYWRWMVVHMWVEVTFEVFTTCIIGYMLVQMGLLTRPMAERVIFLAVMMFLGTALVGISHNFYWIAKPSGIIALGSVFSTLQVLPLLLITLDAWRLRLEKVRAQDRQRDGAQGFVMDGVWSFILAVNFWNIFGAGVFGSLINLPIVNYFEHGTYLTGNHAHAAMFGVKGNVAIAGMLFCCQHLFRRSSWNAVLIRTSFWSLNGGLALMMFLDLFPVGLYQFTDVVSAGFWHARTQAVVTGPVFVALTWMRALGGSLFLFGGVVPLVWFILSRSRHLVPEGDVGESEWTVYERDWATAPEPAPVGRK